MIWFTQAQPIDVVAYIALAATFSLGLVATMLATAQLWVALRVNARIGKLERRVSDNEEIAQLAERRVDLTVKALHALQRYLTAVDYELDAPILSDAQRCELQSTKSIIQREILKLGHEFSLFHYERPRRVAALRILAFQNGDYDSLAYIEAILEIRRKSVQPDDLDEMKHLKQSLQALKGRLRQISIGK